MAKGKKGKKANVTILSSCDGQMSPRVTLEHFLEESSDWEGLVIVFRKKGESFNKFHQIFAGGITYQEIQWLLSQAALANGMDNIRLQSILDEQEGD